MIRRGNESELHFRIKRAAWRWLWERGCRAIAFEALPDPKLGARVDVLAVAPDKATYVIEAKQSRGDFLRDLAKEAAPAHRRALEALEALWSRYELAVEGARQLARERGLTSHLDVAELAPFAEAHLELALRARRRLARTSGPDDRKFGMTQLGRIARFRYVAAPPHVGTAEELPDGWGLLSFDDATETVVVAKPARPGRGDPARVLAEVARVNTQDLMHAGGVTWRRSGPRWPRAASR
jgi:hypothetical protein